MILISSDFYKNFEPYLAIWLNFAWQFGNITGNKTYYIAVLPGTLSQGFRVILTPTVALGSPITTVIKSSSKSFEIKRNSNWNLGTIYGVQVGDIMLDDESVVCVANGDYLPKDLWSSAVGVVAHIYSNSDKDRECYKGLATALSGKAKKPTGLVLALKNAATEVAWSTITDKFIAEETNASSMAEAYKLRDGYANTQAVYSYINKNGYSLSTDAPAFYAVSTYSAKTPTNSTGWYLPSYGEWCDIMKSLGGLTDTAPMASTDGSITYPNTNAAVNINAALIKAVYRDNFTLYWSSTESPATQDGDSNIRAFQVGVHGGTAYYWRATKNLVPNVRCVFAF